MVPRDFQNSDIRLRRPTVCAFRKLLRSKILVVIMSPIPVRNYIEVSMPFVPIELEEYVTKFLANNPGNERSKVTARLKETLAEFKAGALCLRCSNLGNRFRGSGHACFTCITGEAECLTRVCSRRASARWRGPERASLAQNARSARLKLRTVSQTS